MLAQGILLPKGLFCEQDKGTLVANGQAPSVRPLSRQRDTKLLSKHEASDADSSTNPQEEASRQIKIKSKQMTRELDFK